MKQLQLPDWQQQKLGNSSFKLEQLCPDALGASSNSRFVMPEKKMEKTKRMLIFYFTLEEQASHVKSTFVSSANK